MELSIQGERFGKLVVVGPSSEIKYGCHTVLCQCDCGETVSVPPARLWNGQQKSCGYGRGKRTMPSEMIGKKFGDLTVLELTDHLIHKTRTYLCRCDCGNLTYVLPSNLKNGWTCQEKLTLKTHKMLRMRNLQTPFRYAPLRLQISAARPPVPIPLPTDNPVMMWRWRRSGPSRKT